MKFAFLLIGAAAAANVAHVRTAPAALKSMTPTKYGPKVPDALPHKVPDPEAAEQAQVERLGQGRPSPQECPLRGRLRQQQPLQVWLQVRARQEPVLAPCARLHRLEVLEPPRRLLRVLLIA